MVPLGRPPRRAGVLEAFVAEHGATPFHRQAWQACMSIPFGETRTYKWLATQAGKPKAPRAAGQSMARNRLPIVVPCHRVIAADGGLRGFGAGATQLDLKQSLLSMEADANWAVAVPAGGW